MSRRLVIYIWRFSGDFSDFNGIEEQKEKGLSKEEAVKRLVVVHVRPFA
jgi:hypothetical protein